jgi:hypothetical protein
MGLDIDACGVSAVEFLVRFSELIAQMEWGSFTLELNPVSVSPARAVPLDGLLVTEYPDEAPSAPGRPNQEKVA